MDDFRENIEKILEKLDRAFVKDPDANIIMVELIKIIKKMDHENEVLKGVTKHCIAREERILTDFCIELKDTYYAEFEN